MISQNKYIITIGLLSIAICAAFAGGIELGFHGESLTSTYTVGQIIHGDGEAKQPVSYGPLWTVLNDVQQNYIDASTIDSQAEMYGAIKGAVAAVGDPYTLFFDPKDYASFSSQLSGNFEGIGVEIAEQNNVATVVSVIKDSPALAAGLAAGDEVLKVNGTDTTKLSLDDVAAQIRGAAGTSVTLTIYRPSASKQMDFTIMRKQITLKTVAYSVETLANGKKYELIDIAEFGDDTTKDFGPAAADAVKNKVSGIILDLRGNPGGYLNSAVAIASYWLPKGQLVVTENQTNQQPQPYYSAGNDTLNALPTVVVVDGGTASAAEILSGALHDHGNAKLVGVKTFGKGSVQQLITDGLPAGTALKVTIAKWFTPNGQNLNHNGLDPDVNVTISADDLAAKKDPQMDQAKTTLQSELK